MKFISYVFLSALILNTAFAQNKNASTSKKETKQVKNNAPQSPEPPSLDNSEDVTTTNVNSILLSGFPFIFPGLVYLDSRLQYEHSLTKDFTLALGLTYKYENFPDAKISYKTNALGPNLYVKYFFNDWFVNTGLDYLKVHVKNTSKNTEAKDSTAVVRIIVGNKTHLSEYLFYELGLGASYYFKDIKDKVDSKGYKKGVLPAIHFGFGLKF